MNKQHVFDKFDIIYKLYNVKKTFICTVLQWEIERKFVVLITVTHKKLTCHRHMKFTYSNTKYHIMTFMLLNCFLLNVDLGKNKLLT